MNRRAFLQRPAAVLAPPASTENAAQKPVETLSPHANRVLPAGLAATSTTLAPYTGPWGYEQAAHLLRRSLVGPTRAEVLAAAGSSLAAVLDGLFTAAPAPAPPVNGFSTNTIDAVGQTWVTAPFNNTVEGSRNRSLRAWWADLLLQSTTLTEQMTLFWHNHFVVSFDQVFDSRYAYRYLSLLRQQALGNVRQLAKDVTIEPAILDYLSGTKNRVGAPNENYGRELLELFTLGKGALIGPGNYTTYTEDDVQAAARVLTGWQNLQAGISSSFAANRHDPGTKQFSAAFGNRTIANQGATEYLALLDMIFDRPETAQFLARKLYRWFVYYVIDAQTEQDIIQPLAAQLQQNGYDIAPVLRTLLGSEHFFDVLSQGCVIKSPVSFTLGVVRQLQVVFPPATNVVAQYGLWDYLVSNATLQQQRLGDPPNVAGWPAYWQTPQYYEIWINAVTLPRRNQLTDGLISARGIVRNIDGTKYALKIDAIGLAQALPSVAAADPNLLIAELVKLLLPLLLTDNQTAFLKNALLPGLPDFEWTNEWNQFLATPTKTAVRMAVETKLQALLRSRMGLAEQHLS